MAASIRPSALTGVASLPLVRLAWNGIHIDSYGEIRRKHGNTRLMPAEKTTAIGLIVTIRTTPEHTSGAVQSPIQTNSKSWSRSGTRAGVVT